MAVLNEEITPHSAETTESLSLLTCAMIIKKTSEESHSVGSKINIAYKGLDDNRFLFISNHK